MCNLEVIEEMSLRECNTLISECMLHICILVCHIHMTLLIFTCWGYVIVRVQYSNLSAYETYLLYYVIYMTLFIFTYWGNVIVRVQYIDLMYMFAFESVCICYI